MIKGVVKNCFFRLLSHPVDAAAGGWFPWLVVLQNIWSHIIVVFIVTLFEMVVNKKICSMMK